MPVKTCKDMMERLLREYVEEAEKHINDDLDWCEVKKLKTLGRASLIAHDVYHLAKELEEDEENPMLETRRYREMHGVTMSGGVHPTPGAKPGM